MQPRKLIVTHHSPDLDAVGAVWTLKRFASQEFADAKVGFVNPGTTISFSEAAELGCELHEAVHVDTGLGEFDHHQEDRGKQFLSATLLTYQYVCNIHPELKQDKALEYIANFVTHIDHFQEVHWPDAGDLRYSFMIHELIKGLEFSDQHSDESQMHFGLMCLDSAYAVITQNIKAEEIIAKEGQEITLTVGKALALETSNDDTIKLAQKRGYDIVIRKDPDQGNIRIKARPDVEFDLSPLRDKILAKDTKGSWYYHPSGKMLINGSLKHRNQTASPLTLKEIIQFVQELYG